MLHNKKAFTLVEMLVALSVSSIIVAATYASFQLIQKQYKKNIDVTELHSSGRAVMKVLEREIRMAGYEYRDSNGVMTYGSILNPIEVSDSGNKCCDEVTIVYDEVFDTVNAQGVVIPGSVNRIQTRFYTVAHTTSTKGARFRLVKRTTILGTNNGLLPRPIVGPVEWMADFVEDLQFINTTGKAFLYATDAKQLHVYDTNKRTRTKSIALGYDPSGSISIGSSGLIYSLVWFLGKWAGIEIDPVSGASPMFFSPGSGNRWAPGVGIGVDGLLYINTAGSKVDVYDPTTKQLKSTVTPTNSIKNLLDSSKVTNSNGVVCEASKVSTVINCSNNSITLNGTQIYKHLEFSSDDTLYATAHNSFGASIDIFSLASQSKIGEILVDVGNKTWGLTSASNVKKLSTVKILLGLRSKGLYGKKRQSSKKSYHAGNFNFIRNDKYQRDTFTSTVAMRNL